MNNEYYCSLARDRPFAFIFQPQESLSSNFPSFLAITVRIAFAFGREGDRENRFCQELKHQLVTGDCYEYLWVTHRLLVREFWEKQHW